MKYLFYLSIVTMIALTSCSSSASEVLIRIENIGTEDFESVLVESGVSHSYGDLAAGTKTDYKAFELAYRYAYIEVQIDTDTFILQPIDFVGETPLEPGNYTYQLETLGNGQKFGNLNLVFQED